MQKFGNFGNMVISIFFIDNYLLICLSNYAYFILLFLKCNMCSLYLDYSSSAVGQICAMWQAYLFRGISQ